MYRAIELFYGYFYEGRFAFTALKLLVRQLEGIRPVKTYVGYVGVLMEMICTCYHIASSLAAAKPRVIRHSATSLPRLSWKLHRCQVIYRGSQVPGARK